MAMLEAHRQRQENQKLLAGDRWEEHGMIFTTSICTSIDQTKVSREFKRILREANLPDIRFHDLRHTSTFAWADSKHQTIGEPCPGNEQTDVDHDLAAIHLQLNEAALQTACAAGRVMTLEGAIAFALAE